MTESLTHKKILFIVAGPTAVGKTTVAIDLALKLKTEILSADSRQIYKELKIGTAKPTAEELALVRHHFIDEISIEASFTAADYERAAIARLTELFEKRDVVVCAGGTGLYLRALIHGLDDIPDIPRAVELKLEADLTEYGMESLVNELMERDKQYAIQVDQQNPHRVIRALAVCRHTNKPYSSFLSGVSKSRDFACIPVCLKRDREALYNRINLRVDQMMDKGLLDEVKKLEPFKYQRALQTVGYKELFEYFSGTYDLDRAVELIKQNSRRYAKRQMTWFRNQGNWNYIEADDPNLLNQLFNLIP